jgi:hypothetical protein
VPSKYGAHPPLIEKKRIADRGYDAINGSAQLPPEPVDNRVETEVLVGLLAVNVSRDEVNAYLLGK